MSLTSDGTGPSLHVKSLKCDRGITLTACGNLFESIGGQQVRKNQVVLGVPPICDQATKDGEVVLNGWHFLDNGTFYFRDGPCLNMNVLVEDLYGPEGVMCHMLAKKHKTKK